jgi:CRP-like cAMP-binding protein
LLEREGVHVNVGEATTVGPIRDGIRERLVALRGAGIFANIDVEGATLLAEHARIRLFEPGATVIGGDRAIDSVHIILEGSLVVGFSDGRKLTLGPGRPVGLIGIFFETGNGPASVAQVPTRTLEIPRGAFIAVLEENFSLWRSALAVVASTIIETRGELPPPSDSEALDHLPDRERPRTLVERVMDFSSVNIFTDANIDAVFDIARILREVHVPAGHVFWRIRDPAETPLRVVSGTVRCTDANGNTTLAGRDFMLGSLAAFAHRPHGYEARAETDVSAYEMRFEDLLVVFEAHPELGLRLLAGLVAALAARAVPGLLPEGVATPRSMP